MNDSSESTELNNILKSTSLGESILKGVPQLRPDDTAVAAAEAMRSQKHGSVLVCSNGALVGIFTERDWLKLIEGDRDQNAPLADVMTEHPQTLTTSDCVFDAIRLMDERGFRRVPVVDEAGTPVGIVDVKTVVHLLVEQFPEAVYNQASHEQLTAKNREGA